MISLRTLLLYTTLISLSHAHAKLSVDLPFSDHMVFPRNTTTQLSGTSPANSNITITFAGTNITTTSNNTGHWTAPIKTNHANSHPQSLVISSHNDSITLHDILIGDVWLASGQSNMRWMLKDTPTLNQTTHPQVRLFDLTTEIYPNDQPYQLELLRKITTENYFQSHRWLTSTPDNSQNFSAVAFHFAVQLADATNIPIGIIHNSIGGSPMESWIPINTIASDHILHKILPDWINNPHLPLWIRQRAHQNLKTYFDSPDGNLPHHPFEPGFLFQAGITPFTNFPIKGIIWYQGESNATQSGPGTPAIDPALNKHTFITLINSWRNSFHNPQLPFYFVQLPNLNRNWPLFREMQLEVSQEIPHTGMAVTIDLGHPTNVHPTNKKPVGQRLALLALAHTYAAQNIPNSPHLTNIKSNTLTFSQPITTRGDSPPRGFKIAGEDQQFHTATATIQANQILLTSPHVTSPQAIRYGWENNPNINLISTTGLPVSPFRTDRWAQTTPKNFQLFAGNWLPLDGLVQLNKKLARSGQQCIHLLGSVEFTPQKNIEPNSKLKLWAERWTSRPPFTFRIEAKTGDTWQEIHNGDNTTKVGRGFLNHIILNIPPHTTSFRFTSTAPEGTGILIDDLTIAPAKPMKFLNTSFTKQVNPILIGKTDNPILEFTIKTTGELKPLSLTALNFTTTGPNTTHLQVNANGKPIGEIKNGSFTGNHPLTDGDNQITITGSIDPNTPLNTQLNAFLNGIEINGKKIETKFESFNRTGLALRQSGQDNCHTYRIPGITTTNQGTLIAVYDNRYRSGGDLPGDIDVGMSRSTDGGQTWEKMRVIMDMGNDPKWNYDGIGDPSILTDKTTGTIWVAATWSHGNRSWNGSGPGLEPNETGQFMLSKSNDDGLTWSKPINITKQIKDPNWRFVLQGPGNGITLKDGTLVFPAQFRDANGIPHSTIIHSNNHGESWTIGTGVKPKTTEAQIVQLGDGTIMINCRDDRGGSRSIYTTTDLGKTWLVHPTSRTALPEPVCNADLMRIVHKKHGPLLIFSNPNTTSGRHHFTLKVSRDEGLTWPEKYHTLYDHRGGAGYSTLTQIDEENIGVLYEGPGGLFFLKYNLEELIK